MSKEEKAQAISLILDQHRVVVDYRKAKVNDKVSVELVHNMAKMGMSMTMIAGCFGISLRTFKRRMIDLSQLKEAFYAGRAEGIGRVQDTAYALAKSGIDPQTTRWFLDKFGGDIEREALALDEEESNIIDVSSNKTGPMTQEELKKIVGEALNNDPMLRPDPDEIP